MPETSFDREAIIVDIARVIWKHEISINDLYEVLGADLDSHRLDAGDVISELSGIMTGWKTKPDED